MMEYEVVNSVTGEVEARFTGERSRYEVRPVKHNLEFMRSYVIKNLRGHCLYTARFEGYNADDGIILTVTERSGMAGSKIVLSEDNAARRQFIPVGMGVSESERQRYRPVRFE